MYHNNMVTECIKGSSIMYDYSNILTCDVVSTLAGLPDRCHLRIFQTSCIEVLRYVIVTQHLKNFQWGVFNEVPRACKHTVTTRTMSSIFIIMRTASDASEIALVFTSNGCSTFVSSSSTTPWNARFACCVNNVCARVLQRPDSSCCARLSTLHPPATQSNAPFWRWYQL